jgi:hypothetical protein
MMAVDTAMPGMEMGPGEMAHADGALPPCLPHQPGSHHTCCTCCDLCGCNATFQAPGPGLVRLPFQSPIGSRRFQPQGATVSPAAPRFRQPPSLGPPVSPV